MYCLPVSTDLHLYRVPKRTRDDRPIHLSFPSILTTGGLFPLHFRFLRLCYCFFLFFVFQKYTKLLPVLFSPFRDVTAGRLESQKLVGAIRRKKSLFWSLVISLTTNWAARHWKRTDGLKRMTNPLMLRILCALHGRTMSVPFWHTAKER